MIGPGPAPRSRGEGSTPTDDWRSRSEGRRRAAADARLRQRRVATVVAAALGAVVLLLLGWGALRLVAGALGGATHGRGVVSAGRDVGGGSSDRARQKPSGGANAGGAAVGAAAPVGPIPSSIVNYRVTERLFTPSTIGNPFGKYYFIPKTGIRISARRPVASVKIVALPPAGYAASGDSTPGAATAPVPATMIYRGPLRRGVTLIPFSGQTATGYALPRGIYRLRLTVLRDPTSPSDVAKSAETTVQLASFVTIGNRTKGLVAITIDDGWRADPRIFALLKAEHVPATAFFIGGRGVADTHPELVRNAIAAGMEIANHSYDHAWLIHYTDLKIAVDARMGQASVQRVSGYNHHWLRPSGGAMDPRTIVALYRAGFVPVQWSVDTEDTNSRRTAAMRIATTMAAVKALGSGTIILCHWGGYTTYDVLKAVIPKIRAMGLGFGTLSQVMQGTPGFTDHGPAPAMIGAEPPR